MEEEHYEDEDYSEEDPNTTTTTESVTRKRKPQSQLSDKQKEEQNHFQKVVESFAYYWLYSTRRLDRTIKNFDKLNERHKQLVPGMTDKIKRWRAAIEVNSNFIEEIITQKIFMEEDMNLPSREDRNTATDFNMEKVTSTLRQLCREWSVEGEEERRSSYGIIIEELERVLPVDPNNPYIIKVLCPGSGLGRLPYEICKRGYSCQGNEYSYFMLITSNYILNMTKQINQYEIYPYIHQISNIVNTEDQFKKVLIPDVSPSSLPEKADFSYAAGDWLEVFKEHKDKWDCIVTCFFLGYCQ